MQSSSRKTSFAKRNRHWTTSQIPEYMVDHVHRESERQHFISTHTHTSLDRILVREEREKHDDSLRHIKYDIGKGPCLWLCREMDVNGALFFFMVARRWYDFFSSAFRPYGSLPSSPFPFVDGLLYPSDRNAAGGVIGVTGYVSELGIKSGCSRFKSKLCLSQRRRRRIPDSIDLIIVPLIIYHKQ